MITPYSNVDARIAVFDVCGTLYATNTTAGFLSYFHAKVGNAGFSHLRWAVGAKSSPLFWPLAAIYHGTGLDLPRHLLLHSLAGVAEVEVRSAADRYVAEVLPPQRIEKVQAHLHHHRDTGHRILLMSNSIDPVVEAIARSLDVEWRATMLQRKGDRLTGRIARDLTGKKHEALREILGGAHSAPPVSVYTDNLSDRTLVDMAEEAVIVCRNEKVRRRWGSIKANYLVS